mgnify:FL=1
MPDSSDIEAKVVLNLNALVFRRRKEMVMQYVEEKRPRSGRTAEPPGHHLLLRQAGGYHVGYRKEILYDDR